MSLLVKKFLVFLYEKCFRIIFGIFDFQNAFLNHGDGSASEEALKLPDESDIE